MNSNIIGKKILLTGVNGMLCEDIIKLFKNKNAILYTEYFDVNDEFKWKEIITNFKPEIVIINNNHKLLNKAKLNMKNYCEYFIGKKYKVFAINKVCE